MLVPATTRARWATTVRRVLIAVLTGAGLLMGAVGVVLAPALLPCWFVLGAVVAGAIYARLVERTKPGSADARRACRDLAVLVGLGSAVACTVLVGLVIVFGSVSGPVVLILVLAGAPRMWRGLQRGRAWTPPSPAPAPAAPPVIESVAPETTTAELCLTWRRSYLALLDTPSGPDRDRVVDQRRELLDELHRRDPDGFARWLDTGARANGDPGRYLGTGR